MQECTWEIFESKNDASGDQLLMTTGMQHFCEGRDKSVPAQFQKTGEKKLEVIQVQRESGSGNFGNCATIQCLRAQLMSKSRWNSLNSHAIARQGSIEVENKLSEIFQLWKMQGLKKAEMVPAVKTPLTTAP